MVTIVGWSGLCFGNQYIMALGCFSVVTSVTTCNNRRARSVGNRCDYMGNVRYSHSLTHHTANGNINTVCNDWNRFLADSIFIYIFLNENVWMDIKMSVKFVPKGPINNIQALVQIMAWCRPGDKPLSEPMMVTLLMQICVTQPQRVKMSCSIRQTKCYPQSLKWLSAINVIFFILPFMDKLYNWKLSDKMY